MVSVAGIADQLRLAVRGDPRSEDHRQRDDDEHDAAEDGRPVTQEPTSG